MGLVSQPKMSVTNDLRYAVALRQKPESTLLHIFVVLLSLAGMLLTHILGRSTGNAPHILQWLLTPVILCKSVHSILFSLVTVRWQTAFLCHLASLLQFFTVGV